MSVMSGAAVLACSLSHGVLVVVLFWWRSGSASEEMVDLGREFLEKRKQKRGVRDC